MKRLLTFSQELLDRAVELGRKYTRYGEVADYIPELKKQNFQNVALAVIQNGEALYAGEVDTPFSIQSIVKVILYALALENYTVDELKRNVGLKPSAKPFNSVIELELSKKNVPVNPFINAGAIVTVALLHEIYQEKTMGVILNYVSKFLGRDVTYSQDIFMSERVSSFANRTLTYLMLTKGILPKDLEVEEVLDVYFKSCSIMVTCKDLAHMSYVLSNKGVNPDGTRVIDEDIARVLRTLMATCGTYDYAGDFAVRVGIPAKSGVGGGIVTASLDGYGLAVYSPGLDSHGNSYSGVRMLEFLSRELGLNIY
ncbi:glutaminase A [Peptoniphilus equinus]|uniref:Glutaminase n=1 Tax=Peptoniphilus equinus TaxID=3016343 RepID=A0ABY7QSP3_9FIRM|nr:glutaminase A [Peptoniphilus equinus]WBW49805.1 glutaminase A [Peptoniphilus equinus]